MSDQDRIELHKQRVELTYEIDTISNTIGELIGKKHTKQRARESIDSELRRLKLTREARHERTDRLIAELRARNPDAVESAEAFLFGDEE